MSLNDYFNARAAEAQNTRIEKECARLLRVLKQDVERARQLADGKGNILTRHGFNGAGSYASGIFKYRLMHLKSEASYKFDTWYHNGQQLEKLINRLLPYHPAFKALHEFCADPDNNFCIRHDVDKDMAVKVITPTHYVFKITVTVELRKPYTESRPQLVDPAKLARARKPVPAPAPQAPAQITPAPLTKQQVAEYLRNLRNDTDKREFIELLGGTPAPKPAPRILLQKPKGSK